MEFDTLIVFVWSMVLLSAVNFYLHFYRNSRVCSFRRKVIREDTARVIQILDSKPNLADLVGGRRWAEASVDSLYDRMPTYDEMIYKYFWVWPLDKFREEKYLKDYDGKL